MPLPLNVKLLMSYIFTACILTAVIVNMASQGDQSIAQQVISEIDKLEAKVDRQDKRFCALINQMHEVRGFEVLDCDSGEVDIRSVE